MGGKVQVAKLNNMNAPRVSIGTIAANPGEQVAVPITVLDECDVNSITLSISFRKENVRFVRWIKDDFMPQSVMVNIVPTPGNPNRSTMMYSWVPPTGENAHIKNNTVLAIALFEYLGGDSKFMFSNYDGTSAQGDYRTCEFSTFENGVNSVLEDMPTEDYYTNGEFLAK